MQKKNLMNIKILQNDFTLQSMTTTAKAQY